MRSLLHRALVALICICAAGAAPGSAAAQSMPLTITNQTGFKGPIHVTIYGSTNPNKPKTWYYLSKIGAKTIFTPSTAAAKDYGFSFSGSSTQVLIPMLQSARVYFSFCAPVKLTVDASGVPSTPNGWTPGSLNFNTFFDFVEYTWVPNTGAGGGTQIWVDTTQVDAFGLPVRMTLTGKPGAKPVQLTGGFDSSSAGANIISTLKKAGQPWSNLIVSDKTGPIRIISPVHTMSLASDSPYHFDGQYWENYIKGVFARYSRAGSSFKIDTGAAEYTGVVKNAQMVLTPNNGEAATIFATPRPQDLWGNGVPLVNGPNAASLQKYIQAAFLRSTFLTNSNLSDCSGVKPYTAAPVNFYSKVIHQYAYQQQAYTFPYDDVCSLSSTISLLKPLSLNLTLLPLNPSMANRKCP